MPARARPRRPLETAFAAVLLGLILPAAASAARAAVAEADSALRLERMTFVASRAGRTEVLLQAARARLNPEADVVDLEDVRAVVMSEDGRPGLELRCQRGEFDLATQDFVATGDVRGRASDGRRFASSWVRYDHSRGLAFTDAPVLIREGGRTLRGGGLRYHVRDGTLRLLGGASVVQAP